LFFEPFQSAGITASNRCNAQGRTSDIFDDGERQAIHGSGFGNWFREQCDAARISKAAHGLRKAGTTRLAEHGCTDHEIMAWGGWTSLKEVQRYTRAANRMRLALQASERLKAGTKVSNLKTRSVKPGKKNLINQGEQIRMATPAVVATSRHFKGLDWRTA
jgi:hypothetical protein